MKTVTWEKLAEEIKIDGKFRDISDPAYVGPGTWYYIHKESFLAQNHQDQLNFIVKMKQICKEFPCKVCSGHCQEYIKANPMEEYVDMKIIRDGRELDNGLFLWSWRFHNVVNKRLGKSLMTFANAYKIFSDDSCSEVCMVSK